VRIEHSLISFQDAAAPGFAAIDLWNGEPIYVAGDARGIGRALVRCLARDGVTAHLVETPPQAARRLLVLGSLTADSIDHALAIARGTLGLVASHARVWDESDGLLVTVEPDQDVEARGASAWLGGLTALCRTARVELPRLTARAIHLGGSLDDVEAVARVIATELLAGGSEPEVRLDIRGRRQRPQLEPGAAIPGDLPIERGSVLVASAGGRGITAEAVIAIARQVPLRALLLGRTPLTDEPDACQGVTDQAELGRIVLQHARARGADCSPGELRAAVSEIVAARAIARTLARLRETGSEVRYVAADVRDARAVAAAVDSVRRDWGPIGAVIHGAGALADAWLRDKTDAHVERVFAPKLSGLANLLSATADDPLRLLCGFSSVAAHAANAGQADYAMANSILERVLAAEAARRGPSCRVRALAWGPWDGGMVTPHLREKFARDGVGLVETEAGTAAMLREFRRPGTGTTVVLTAGQPGGRAQEPPVEGRFVVTVTPALYPELADHRIKDRMVVPMALVVEWLARLLRILHPDASRLRLGHLQVLRPVVIPDRTDTPVRLRLQYRRDADGQVAHVRVIDTDGKPCYESTILLALDSDAIPPDADGVPKEGQASACPASTGDDMDDVRASATAIAQSVDQLYDDGPLFHGPRFQVLRAVDSVSATFARARIATTSAMRWPGTYIADPAMVDGALQLALVWAYETTGQRCVPMRFGAVDVALDARPAPLVTATLAAPPISGATLRASVRVSGETGAVLVDIRDVEGYAIPPERPRDLRPTVASDVES
jgi:NAD(P)-dependent dehydrogenase (short-subunit alcohol dehydrogenase family)